MTNTEALQRAVEILPKFTGSISIVASTLVARHIITTKQWREISLTNMMMFYISIVDIIDSFFVYFMSTWMAPPSDLPLIYTAGTTASCTAQGFIAVFSFAYFSTSYTLLAVLYWLIVRHGWTQTQMKKKGTRLSFLLPPLLAALCFSVPPLFFQMYNPYNFTCFITAYPYNCNDVDIPCARGDINGSITGMVTTRLVLLSYVFLGNTTVFIFMGLLVYAVYKQEKKSDSYRTEGQKKNRKNSRRTAWQGVRFSAAYFVPYLMIYVYLFNDILTRVEGENVDGKVDVSQAAYWVMYYWLAIMTPLLGAFNSAVYFKPRYTMYRKTNSDKSRIRCLCEVLGISFGPMPMADTSEASTQDTPLISEEEDTTHNIL